MLFYLYVEFVLQITDYPLVTNELNNLIKRAEKDIVDRTLIAETGKQGKEPDARRKSRVSAAFAIWILAILLAAFQFDQVVSLVMDPAQEKIESDLDSLLQSTAASLRRYEIQQGQLPPILPNPSIRGLVSYERRTDFEYRLTATIGEVTMVLDSSSTSPHREQP